MSEGKNGTTKRVILILGFVLTILVAAGAAFGFIYSGDNQVRKDVIEVCASKEAFGQFRDEVRGDIGHLRTDVSDLREDIAKIRTEQREDFRALSTKIDNLAKNK